ncbi:MAG: hypothetical protein QHH13_14365 [Melioribacter sp.]|uniref:hypothetical protein n=1 Tax=Rosettibacter primus TaxID=3111523 RepID=UPI00247E6C9F|nr:hypothetical protein [Melioribacter sp.]
MIRKFLLFLIVASPFLLHSCDKGIEPELEKPSGPTGFSGKITFIGKWHEGIKRTHLVVFKNPITKSEDFFPPNLSFVSDSIPYNSKEFYYNSVENNFLPILQLGEGEYSYVVVAQSKSPEISLDRKDWFVVGVYCINGDQTKPAKLKIQAGRITPDINIVVDFNNPPPQPPM